MAGSPAGRRTKRDATGSRLLPSRPANSRLDDVKPSLRLSDRVELLFDLDGLPRLFGQGGSTTFVVDEAVSSGHTSLVDPFVGRTLIDGLSLGVVVL